MSSDAGGGPRGRRPHRPHKDIGRRRRRLKVAAISLVGVALLALTAAFWVKRSLRPETRRPGEDLPEITDNLARALPPEAPKPNLVDLTREAGLSGFSTFAGERTSRLPEDMGGGAAWGDYDGDGDDDLFLVAAGGGLELPREERAPSLLFENLGDGGFRRVPGFPDLRILGMGAAWGDADGDGDLDLAVSGFRFLALLRNAGSASFEMSDALGSADGYWAGVSWADFDRDGDLDLYVCGYVRYEEGEAAPPGRGRPATQQYGATVPYTLNPASFEPERNLLFENLGDGAFEEVALPYGVSNPEGRSLSALWHDFDDDGRLDLYVANDISDNAFFLNRGTTFEDAGLAAWVADYRGAMGLAAGDWNRDGDDDLFVTHWLAQENALYDSRLRAGPPDPSVGLLAVAAVDPPARLTFSDLSAPLGLGPIALQLVGWGTEFVDLDADGWLDLVVANGSTLEDKSDPRRLVPQPPFLLWNARGQGFFDLAPGAPALAAPRVGRGVAVSDYDRDGDVDVLLVHHDGGVQLLGNAMQAGHWLELRLRDRRAGGSWGDGTGTATVAWVGGVPLRRAVGGASYLSQSSRTLHFGLGSASTVDRLEVRWPDGSTETHGPLAADAEWEVEQGGAPRRVAPAKSSHSPASGAPLTRQQVQTFWTTQREAMDALKRHGDLDRATTLLRQALAIDPAHEDSRYYLANNLWAQGHRSEALAELAELRRRSPLSHRAHRQYAVLRAIDAATAADLDEAEAAAQRALAVNREETGALLLLGEIALLRGLAELADERLELACRTNPRAVGGFFLRAFIAWQRGQRPAAVEHLGRALEARGEDWKPEGAAAEGDVAARHHRDDTPLAPFWLRWNGAIDPDATFGGLAAYLDRRRGDLAGAAAGS